MNTDKEQVENIKQQISVDEERLINGNDEDQEHHVEQQLQILMGDWHLNSTEDKQDDGKLQNQQFQNGEKEHYNKNKSYSLIERSAMRMARWPKTHFWVALLVTLVASVIGFFVGGFTLDTNNVGWESRGTTISTRQTQLSLLHYNEKRLFNEGESVWEDLLRNVQRDKEDLLFYVQTGGRTFEDDNNIVEDGDDRRNSRRRHLTEGRQNEPLSRERTLEDKLNFQQVFEVNNHLPKMPAINQTFVQSLSRKLQEEERENGDGFPLAGCDFDWYSDGRMFNNSHLSPVWKTKQSSDSFVHGDVLFELCVAEDNTQRFLEENDLCFGCDGGRCLPPFGIVLFARLTVPGGLLMDCTELADAWFPLYQLQTQKEWELCVEGIREADNVIRDGLPDSCGDYFSPTMVDNLFDTTGQVTYTSSMFATRVGMIDELYDNQNSFDRGGDLVEVAYDTLWQDFNLKLQETALNRDMVFAAMSGITTAIAVLVHTRSPFLTLVGLLQIVLSFPSAYFVYTIMGQLKFFPFLNFISVFVVFALGADHIFVAVDKWKNARLENPNATTEEIAAKALPGAASAMFVTTSTTSAAFFATSICAVAPIRMFGVFCGLLISLDYVMDVFLIFPCLCIYDNNREQKSCWMTFSCSCPGKKVRREETPTKKGHRTSGGEEGPSLIHRILMQYYRGLHFFRWPLLVASIVALGVCSYFATGLKPPLSSEVRLFGPRIEYERAYIWRNNLLSTAIETMAGSEAYAVWGLKPADTGNHNDPFSWTQLALDDCFLPSSKEAQIYLRDFCTAMLAEDFARPIDIDYECPINRFDKWLAEQSSSADPDHIYLSHCAGESGLPVEPEVFDPCLIAWSYQEEESTILSRDGVVVIMYVPFRGRIRYDMPNSVVGEEWQLINDWMESYQTRNAPFEVSKGYISSAHFWWYDTNTQMFTTALGSAAISLGVAGIVIFMSSRSLAMTVFSVISIAYVLTSVTSLMVAAGWTLGFLESICFSVLIGVSVDFVIHFSHAYSHKPGNVSREERTVFALLHMGPSVLAAGATTLAGAMVMLLTEMIVYQKFAQVLFFPIIQATIGSFVVFFTLTDTVGPSNPTFLLDRISRAISLLKGSDSKEWLNSEERAKTTSSVGESESSTIPHLHRSRLQTSSSSSSGNTAAVPSGDTTATSRSSNRNNNNIMIADPVLTDRQKQQQQQQPIQEQQYGIVPPSGGSLGSGGNQTLNQNNDAIVHTVSSDHQQQQQQPIEEPPYDDIRPSDIPLGSGSNPPNVHSVSPDHQLQQQQPIQQQQYDIIPCSGGPLASGGSFPNDPSTIQYSNHPEQTFPAP